MAENDLKRKADEADIGNDDELEDLATAKSKHLAIEREKASMARLCPYLDTIDRNVLDFGERTMALFSAKVIYIMNFSFRLWKTVLSKLVQNQRVCMLGLWQVFSRQRPQYTRLHS